MELPVVKLWLVGSFDWRDMASEAGGQSLRNFTLACDTGLMDS